MTRFRMYEERGENEMFSAKLDLNRANGFSGVVHRSEAFSDQLLHHIRAFAVTLELLRHKSRRAGE